MIAGTDGQVSGDVGQEGRCVSCQDVNVGNWRREDLLGAEICIGDGNVSDIKYPVVRRNENTVLLGLFFLLCKCFPVTEVRYL